MNNDTIAAIATPSGTGGVSVIRVSGKQALVIAEKIARKKPSPRAATFAHFFLDDVEIDSGLIIYFPAPNSFTGEDVIEFQGHGGQAVTQLLLQAILANGARLAEAGEFSKRAFLNDKIDLAQAEAIADLIHARSFAAVKAANRSLQGDFSRQVNELAAKLLDLRVYLEASLDFPEEEIDFLTEGAIEEKLIAWHQQLQRLIKQTQQGKLINNGINLVLSGKPNAGKSSLLNALLGEERAIVTHQAGTTRDIIREQIVIHGIPVNVIDTAGLRESEDIVEREGIRRSREAIANADIVLQLIDGETREIPEIDAPQFLRVYNKADKVMTKNPDEFWISAHTGEGIDALKDKIAQLAGQESNEENIFIARERHQQALITAEKFTCSALEQFKGARLGELIAEDLRGAHDALGEITGKIRADDLLGVIFSNFCIGK